ncbi:MAG TPA: hypothetical protein VG034_26955 [Acidimicrobiia bacterium]|nr:hypothetical protein [Acidimicrobiia bacterium]
MTFRRALIAAVVSAVVLTGCGAAEKVSPRVAVREAAKETASQKEGTYTLTIQGSEADLNAVLNEGLPLSAEDREGINLLRNGHIAVSTAADKFGLDIKAGDLEHAFELRYVDKKLYARADVAGLAKLFGASPDEVNQTVQALASQEGFEFLAAAASGKWLVADFSALKNVFEGLGKQFGLETGGSTGETGGSTATSGPPGGGEFQALKDALGKALSEDVTIQELKSDSVGDHYLATVTSMRAFYAKVRPIFQQHAGTYAGDLPPDTAVPDKPGSLDVWVKSGRVSRVELDLDQFSPAPPAGAGRVALRLDISNEAPALAAPPDAVPVDIAGLLGKFFSQFGQFLQGVGNGLSSNYD